MTAITLNTVETMSALELLQIEVWEAYKDVRGIRPRHLGPEVWTDPVALQSILDGLFSE